MGSAGDAGVMCDKHASSCAVEDVFMIVFKYMLHPLLFLCLFLKVILLISQSVLAVCVMFGFCCGGNTCFVACVFAQEHAQICYLNCFLTRPESITK